MRRREFLGVLSGAAAWPLTAFAQQTPTVGFLNSRSADEAAIDVDGFRKGLAETGYLENRNVKIEYRWAEGKFDRLPALAAELVGRGVTAIAATGGEPAALAAKIATTTTPIVFIIGGDPVESGLVTSFNRPGGNLTGVSLLLTAMEGKRLGLLREVIPTATLIALLINPAMPTFDRQWQDVQDASRTVSQQMQLLRAANEAEIDAAFANAAKMQVGALLVGTDPYMLTRRDQLVALAARYAIPVMYPVRDFAIAGGLMSYGISLVDAYRQAGIYIGRILKGQRAAELPIQQPTKFEFVINLKTAKTLGVIVPPALLARTDEVIE